MSCKSKIVIRSGGQIDTGRKKFIVEPSGNYVHVDDIANTQINIPQSENFITLKDIATIKRDFIDPPDKLAYFNGKPAIFFATAMLPDSNILEYAPRFMAKLDEVIQTLPIGYQLDVATYQAEQVEKTVRGVSINVLQTLAIVLVVVVIFLGVRTGLIVGAIVPFVMLSDFIYYAVC